MNTEPCLDITTLEKLMQLGGKEFVTQMLDLFAGYAPRKLAEARAAMQAGDLTGVQKAVHPLKSSAGNIGACLMRDLAKRIERCALDNQPDPIVQLLSELEAAYEQVKMQLQEYRNNMGV